MAERDEDGAPEPSEVTRSITQSVVVRPSALAADDALFEPGTLLGRYVIVRKLGAGGTSLVYKAYDRELDRRIAIKVMRSKHWDQAGQQRALREGQALAKLSHPNVVTGKIKNELGLAFRPLEQTILETMADLERWHHLSNPKL